MCEMQDRVVEEFMRTIRVVLIAVALAGPGLLLAQQPQAESADQQLKAAMHRELVGGDLRAAIKDYEGIVSRHRDNRAVVARALLQIAQCYDKLGQPDARKIYEQIVRDYADQTEPVAQARARLAVLNPPQATTPAPAGGPRLVPHAVTSYLLSASPEGDRAAVIEYSKGMNLAVQDFASSQVKLLTDFDWTTTGVLDVATAWSRDGRQIAYTTFGLRGELATELRTTTLTGETRTIVRADPGRLVLPADWLPDGRSLLAVLDRADKTTAMGLMPIESGAFTPLRSLQWTGGYADRPRVSPDGRFVVFSDAVAGPRDIHVVSVDGRMATRLTDHPAEERSPVWSPDGRHVAFLSTRLGTEALWVVAVKDGQPAGEPVRVRDGMAGTTLRDWTPKGLVYGELARTSDIYSVGLDPATLQPAGRPQQLPYGRTGRNTIPVPSPDGRHLAFVSGSPAEPSRRYVVVLPEKGGSPREFVIPTTRFAPGGLDPYDLRWFGDSTGLGFSGFDEHGLRSVFQLSLANGTWKVLPSPSDRQTFVEWDQTGKHLFYTQGSTSIVERDLEANQDRVLTRIATSGAVRSLRLSPDRRLLAFIVRPNAAVQELSRLMVVDLQSGQSRTLLEAKPETENVVFLGVPAWSPDGRAILVPRTTIRNSWPQLLVVPVDGGASRSIALDSSFVGRSGGEGGARPAMLDISWSPDGARIVFAVQANRSAVWILESGLPAAAPSASPRR